MAHQHNPLWGNGGFGVCHSVQCPSRAAASLVFMFCVGREIMEAVESMKVEVVWCAVHTQRGDGPLALSSARGFAFGYCAKARPLQKEGSRPSLALSVFLCP
mmetsp:Transcript_26044/g.44341  ORF Transcript_26044/g.44341 Transcript_26044/m.44341 type:complete len:102 (-) Transcript_26044:452-757(-)